MKEKEVLILSESLRDSIFQSAVLNVSALTAGGLVAAHMVNFSGTGVYVCMYVYACLYVCPLPF